MKPDKIYLPWEYAEIDVLPPGVTTKQVFGKDVCYVRKDYLLDILYSEKECCKSARERRHFAWVIKKLESL